MKKNKLSYLFILFLLVSCSIDAGDMKLKGDKPPEMLLQIGEKTYPTTLGTYCWKSGSQGICVDTAGPIELLEGKEPIQVKPDEEISFVMKFEQLPNEVHLTQFVGEKQTEVKIEDNRFTAPSEKGVYYYSYGVWWMDEEQENVSHGDAFYAFMIEVK